MTMILRVRCITLLKVSAETVMRDWKYAKVWLLRDLKGAKHDGS